MYVFTDAPPKVPKEENKRREYNRDNAIGYALDYMMPVHFFFSTRGCRNPAKNTDYKSIMEDTGGMSLFFSKASDISSADFLVAADLDGSTIISSGGSRLSRRRRYVSFPVDDSVAKLIISISARYNWQFVKVQDNSGRNVPHKMNMNKGKLWIIDGPSKGMWRIAVPYSVYKLSYQVIDCLIA